MVNVEINNEMSINYSTLANFFSSHDFSMLCHQGQQYITALNATKDKLAIYTVNSEEFNLTPFTSPINNIKTIEINGNLHAVMKVKSQFQLCKYNPATNQFDILFNASYDPHLKIYDTFGLSSCGKFLVFLQKTSIGHIKITCVHLAQDMSSWIEDDLNITKLELREIRNITIKVIPHQIGENNDTEFVYIALAIRAATSPKVLKLKYIIAENEFESAIPEKIISAPFSGYGFINYTTFLSQSDNIIATAHDCGNICFWKIEGAQHCEIKKIQCLTKISATEIIWSVNFSDDDKIMSVCTNWGYHIQRIVFSDGEPKFTTMIKSVTHGYLVRAWQTSQSQILSSNTHHNRYELVFLQHKKIISCFTGLSMDPGEQGESFSKQYQHIYQIDESCYAALTENDTLSFWCLQNMRDGHAILGAQQFDSTQPFPSASLVIVKKRGGIYIIVQEGCHCDLTWTQRHIMRAYASFKIYCFNGQTLLDLTTSKFRAPLIQGQILPCGTTPRVLSKHMEISKDGEYFVFFDRQKKSSTMVKCVYLGENFSDWYEHCATEQLGRIIHSVAIHVVKNQTLRTIYVAVNTYGYDAPQFWIFEHNTANLADETFGFCSYYQRYNPSSPAWRIGWGAGKGGVMDVTFLPFDQLAIAVSCHEQANILLWTIQKQLSNTDAENQSVTWCVTYTCLLSLRKIIGRDSIVKKVTFSLDKLLMLIGTNWGYYIIALELNIVNDQPTLKMIFKEKHTKHPVHSINTTDAVICKTPTNQYCLALLQNNFLDEFGWSSKIQPVLVTHTQPDQRQLAVINFPRLDNPQAEDDEYIFPQLADLRGIQVQILEARYRALIPRPDIEFDNEMLVFLGQFVLFSCWSLSLGENHPLSAQIQQTWFAGADEHRWDKKILIRIASILEELENPSLTQEIHTTARIQTLNQQIIALHILIMFLMYKMNKQLMRNTEEGIYRTLKTRLKNIIEKYNHPHTFWQLKELKLYAAFALELINSIDVNQADHYRTLMRNAPGMHGLSEKIIANSRKFFNALKTAIKNRRVRVAAEGAAVALSALDFICPLIGIVVAVISIIDLADNIRISLKRDTPIPHAFFMVFQLLEGEAYDAEGNFHIDKFLCGCQGIAIIKEYDKLSFWPFTPSYRKYLILVPHIIWSIYQSIWYKRRGVLSLVLRDVDQIITLKSKLDIIDPLIIKYANHFKRSLEQNTLWQHYNLASPVFHKHRMLEDNENHLIRPFSI